jgi:hypothetical protein
LECVSKSLYETLTQRTPASINRRASRSLPADADRFYTSEDATSAEARGV